MRKPKSFEWIVAYKERQTDWMHEYDYGAELYTCPMQSIRIRGLIRYNLESFPVGK